MPLPQLNSFQVGSRRPLEMSRGRTPEVNVIHPRVKVVQVSGALGARRRCRENARGGCGEQVSALLSSHWPIVRRCNEKTTQNHPKLGGGRDKAGNQCVAKPILYSNNNRRRVQSTHLLAFSHNSYSNPLTKSYASCNLVRAL